MCTHVSSYRNEFIRPAIVYRAAQFLVKQPLFMRENVKLSTDWTLMYSNEFENFIVDEENKNEEVIDKKDRTEDLWDETLNDEPINPNKEVTLLKEGIVFAPGEFEHPIPILDDKSCEELSFPTIFCGYERDNQIGTLSYSDICRSELKRYDRRCCIPENIFFKYRKKELSQLRNAINIYLRMGRNRDQPLKVENVLNKEYVDELMRSDDAYKVLTSDRSSPAYWQARMKELMAMIRQIGIPTFFLTLSAAETQWPELLIILKQIIDKKCITKEEALNLTFMEKSDLIRKDPVTCARYFDNRIRQLFKVIKAIRGPFQGYEILDTYIRIEFQSRGSPHVHCLLWLDKAPIFDINDNESVTKCEQFIDLFISCSLSLPELETLGKFQYHKHTKSCQKTIQDMVSCRFGIPYYPMRETKILRPLEDKDLTDEEFELFDILLDRVKELIRDIDQSVKKNLVVLNFDEFLAQLDMNERTYIRVIRNTLKRPQVFLKREPSEIRTNAYNPKILRLHRANMDLQFVLDPYACVHYILNYINKSNRGMSALLREVVNECKQGNLTHQQKLYRICSKFLNCSEVSIQEAVYILLSMPLSQASRDSVFINTGEKKSRIGILKREKDLKLLDPDSTDIMSLSLIDFYINRPDELESLCLADFAANYTNRKFISSEESTEYSRKTYRLKKNLGTISERKKAKIIRYRRYQYDKEPEHFFREKIMLYVPWRDEEHDILRQDVRKLFDEHKELIANKEKSYVYNCDIDYEHLEKKVRTDIVNSMDELDVDIPEEYQVFNLRGDDINLEEHFNPSNNVCKGSFLSPTIMNDTSYSELIRTLNSRQRMFLMGLINHVKTKSEPFYYFLSGGAGTGKSQLIRAVYQTMKKWYIRKNVKTDEITVLLVGPTGKSAFNIRGTTIHSALNIPVTQCSAPMKNLSADLKSKMKATLWYLKAIIIDEVSMVGSTMLTKIDFRLRELFNSSKVFGGISILFVGDLNQLRPVMDHYVFQPATQLDYSILAGNHLWSNVKYFRLTEIMRQREDKIFAECLNRLANGSINDDDQKLLSSRLFSSDDLELPEEAIRLFPHNIQVDRYNSFVIQKRPGIVRLSIAFDKALGELPKQIRDRALFSVGLMSTQKTYNLAKELELKVNVRYMVSTNVDVEDGLVNGTTGILRTIDFLDDKPHRLWFEFEELDIGYKARSRFPKKLMNECPLTPIEKVVRDINTKTEAKIVLVSRTQFPLTVAEALTIHKSQGQTYEKVVIDMTRKQDLAKFYTSFSRAKTLSGLFLTGQAINFPKRRLETHPVEKELRRLETESLLEFDLRFPVLDKQPEDLMIFFQNLPYLLKHQEDIACDPNITACDILIFVELHSIIPNIDGYSIGPQILAGNTRPFGIGTYFKRGLNFDIKGNHSFILEEKSHIEWVAIDLKFTVLIAFYVSPSFMKSKAFKTIEEVVFGYINRNILVVGDWNIERNSEGGREFQVMMGRLGLIAYPKSLSPSTDRGTSIDYLFSNVKTVAASFYESLVSDHKPIICRIPDILS